MSLDDIFKEFGIETEEEQKKEEKPKEESVETKVEKPQEQPKEESKEQSSDVFQEFGFDTTEKQETKEEVKEEPKEQPSSTPKAAPQKQEPIVITEDEEEFDFSEEEEPKCTIVTIYGHKGHGKTDAALSFPGKICVISFDRKATPVKLIRYKDKEIHVWDGKKYYDESSPEAKIKSGEISFRYVNVLLDKVIRKHNPDWIVIDCTDILHEICEMTMRYRNGLMPFQGVANRNLWKERRMYLRQIHNLATSIAKKGVIYTLYPGEYDIKIVDGEVVDREEIPKWIDIVLQETDTVIKIERKFDKEGAMKIFAIVESNKSPLLPFKNGIRVEITDKYCYEELVKASKEVM